MTIDLNADWGPCVLCGEAVGVLDGWVQMPDTEIESVAHNECMMREVLGGIGHLLAHEWWCEFKGDPDAGLTYRQSAQLVDAWVHVVGTDRSEESTVSDKEIERPGNTLLGTDDAQVWAEEFCRIYNGEVIGGDGTGEAVVDVVKMTEWFANAMQAALSVGRDRERRRAESQATLAVSDAEKEAFVEGLTEGRGDVSDLDDPTSP